MILYHLTLCSGPFCNNFTSPHATFRSCSAPDATDLPPKSPLAANRDPVLRAFARAVDSVLELQTHALQQLLNLVQAIQPSPGGAAAARGHVRMSLLELDAHCRIMDVQLKVWSVG